MPSNTANPKQIFVATIESPGDGMDTAYVAIPFSIEEMYGTKGQVKVKASFDGHPYRGVLANMGTGCHVILLRKDVRASIGKQVGDKVKVTIEQDLEERVVEIPIELKKLLNKNAKAKKFFDSLSYTNRKEYVVWITSAKQLPTKEKRLKQVISKLTAGKKNPFAK